MKKSIPVIHLISACGLVTAFIGGADRALAGECKKIHGQLISTPITAGCTSPVGLCTVGMIDGNQGLNGTTAFSADSIAPGPATAPDAAATISYSGVLQITTSHGTLTTRDTGIFDTAEGTPTGGFFSSFDLVLSGTGRFAGARGTLSFVGKTIRGRFVSEMEVRFAFSSVLRRKGSRLNSQEPLESHQGVLETRFPAVLPTIWERHNKKRRDDERQKRGGGTAEKSNGV